MQNFVEFVKKNIPSRIVLSDEDIQHVADCLESLDRLFKREVPQVGSFLTHIANRDFYKALHHADAVNTVALPIYGLWVYNYAPSPDFLTLENLKP